MQKVIISLTILGTLIIITTIFLMNYKALTSFSSAKYSISANCGRTAAYYGDDQYPLGDLLLKLKNDPLYNKLNGNNLGYFEVNSDVLQGKDTCLVVWGKLLNNFAVLTYFDRELNINKIIVFNLPADPAQLTSSN